MPPTSFLLIMLLPGLLIAIAHQFPHQPMGLPGQKSGSLPPGKRENIPVITQFKYEAYFLEKGYLQIGMKLLQYPKQTNNLTYINMTLPTYYDGNKLY